MGAGLAQGLGQEALDLADLADLIEAAGGVLWRPGPTGGIDVLVAHRPKYDDWTFPKGKLDPGEDAETAARREVTEETGLCCILGPELAATTYRDRKGRPKRVRYWAMTVQGGTFVPNDEVDDVRWLDPAAALERLSYSRDHAVLEALLATDGI